MFKKIVSRECISLSIILLRLERSEISRKLLHKVWSSFLKSGITFAVFRFVGKVPVENDKLAKRAIGSFKVF